MKGYAYDADDRQVARTIALNWNGTVPAGGKSSSRIVFSEREDAPPADAVSFEVCLGLVRYEGDEDTVGEFDLCPDERPRSK